MIYMINEETVFLAEKKSPQTRFRYLLHLLKQSAWFYSITIMSLLLLWFLTGEHLFFVRIFVNLMPAVFYPVLILLPVHLILRGWRVVLALMPIFLMFCWLYLGAFLPKPELPSSNEPQISLMTYNILAINRNFDALAAVILEADADIIAVQEVQPIFETYAQENLSVRYPYIVAHIDPTLSSYEGRMILSKYPILTSSTHAGYARTILYLRAEVDVDGEVMVVYNVHLHPPSPHGIFSTAERSGDLQVLLADAAQETLPTVILGDFNMTDTTSDYRAIAAQYTDAYRERARNIGTSHPNVGVIFSGSQLPGFIRIDYLFHDVNFSTEGARVIRGGSSDHFPVFFTLRLSNP